MTDYQQWSSDGDPFSDFDEVSGANMPVAAPYDHPHVAAQHIIAVDLVRYSVTPRAEVTDAQGGSLSAAYTNETSSSYSESISGTATSTVGPAGLAGYSVTGSMTETVATTESTTREREMNWNTATTVDLNAAADLGLSIFIHNAGSAQARDVRLFFNLRLGNEVIASIRTPIVTGLLDAGAQHPSEGVGPWIIADSEDANGTTRPITITMDQLKAIESGAPLTLAVAEVQADILRWSPEGGGSWSCRADISCDWGSFESRIRASTVNLELHVGHERRQFRVFGGKDYTNPSDPDLVMTLRDMLELVADVEGPDDTARIENRPYPSEWYAMTGSDVLVDAWEDAGAPQNLLGLAMIGGTDLRLSSPAADTRPLIDLATFTPDMRRVFVSTRASGGFPLREVVAHVTIDGEEQSITLDPGDGGFYTHDQLFVSPAAGGGEVMVTNARGDVARRTLQLPVSQSASCGDIEAAYALVANGEYLLFKGRDLNRPALAYCRFFSDAPPMTHYWIDRTPTWNEETEVFLGGVTFVDTEKAFAVGSTGTRPVILRTLDAGASWDSVTVRRAGTDPHLNSVDFKPDGSIGIAVGFDYDNVSQGYAIYRSVNGGATWIGPGNFDVLGSAPSFEEIRYAGGTTWFVGGGARFMRSNDDGETWHSVASELFPNDPNVQDIEFKDGSNGLIIAGRSQQISAVFATDDGGDTWSVRREFDEDFHLNKIVYMGGTTWLGGRSIDETSEVYRSDDDGATWSLLADLSTEGAGRLVDLEFTSMERGFVLDRSFDVDLGYFGRIWHTVDGGATWRAETLMSGGEPREISMLNANRGIAVGTEGVLITTSGGGDPDVTVGIESHDLPDVPPAAAGFTLPQNHPNPFSGQTTLTFSLDEPASVTLTVFDVLGRSISTLIENEVHVAGAHRVDFDAGRLAAGLYFYRLDVGEASATKKMALVR